MTTAAEAVPVQLTRMEGVLNLIDHKVDAVGTRMDRAEADIGALKSRTQSLQEGAIASTEKAEALALALKDAKDAVDATALMEANKVQAAAREEAAHAALGWSPVTKVFAVGAAAAVAVNVYQALWGG